MALMVNGKKVLGYAIGGNEFYSLDKLKVSVPLPCDYFSDSSPNKLSVSLDQPLSPGSAFTLRYLRDKGEKIKLIVTLYNNYNDAGPSSDVESDTIDLSKPDSNGHFNFNFQQMLSNDGSRNAYCYSDPGGSNFNVYSDAFGTYFGSYFSYYVYMQVLYLD